MPANKYTCIQNTDITLSRSIDKTGLMLELTGKKRSCRLKMDIASEFDSRDYWGDMRVDIYLDGEYTGYVGESSGYVSPEDEKAAWLMEVAAMDMRTSVENLTFVRMETVACASLPGYDPDTLSHILGSDNHTKTDTDVCRFIYDGQEYFVADLVYNDLHGHTRHLGDYPSWCGG